MEKLLRILTVLGVAVSIVVLAMAPAQAIPSLELGLAIDRSGSISAADLALQKNAYINVLSNAAILPLDGSVAIGIWSFGSTVINHLPVTLIDDAGDIAAIVAAINAIVGGGSTALGPAIQAAQAGLLGSGLNGLRQVIDVSTDGVGNVGINQVVAANAAVAAGIEQVNCLGVGAGANCNFEAGVGAFELTVASFADFENALGRKIIRERGVPAPATLLLLGAGLLGVSVTVRRSRSIQ
ncbi:MAG TPA: DUF1194 domain-containing protein [Methylomirabilota bacterium]|nr:DUF1194 domain-containing protein [Methylomirabilota bacterium]